MDASKISSNLAVATAESGSPFQEEAFAAAKRWGKLRQPAARAELFLNFRNLKVIKKI